MLSALAGGAAATVHATMNWPALHEQTRFMDHATAELTEMPVLMETCCVFFSTIYFVGRWLSQHLIGHNAAVRFHAQGRTHMRLIQICSGTFVVLRQTLLRPEGQPFAWQSIASLALGLTFVVAASFLREMPDWRTMFS